MLIESHTTMVSPGNAFYMSDESSITDFTLVKTVPELYPLLSNCNFSTGIIVIDIKELYKRSAIDAWNSINTLTTIIKSTVYKSQGSIKPEKRNIFIAAGVTTDSDVKLIRDFLSLNELCIGLFPLGKSFSKEEKQQSLKSLQQGTKFIPALIQEKLNSKRKLKDNEINLTLRQQQVHDLIVERGASNKVIARSLNITESTVKLHITAIMKKYGVRNRTQLAVFAKKELTNH